MLFNDLLGIADEPVQLIERSFSDQKTCKLTRHQLTEIVRSGTPFGEVIRITGAGGPGARNRGSGKFGGSGLPDDICKHGMQRSGFHGPGSGFVRTCRKRPHCGDDRFAVHGRDHRVLFDHAREPDAMRPVHIRKKTVFRAGNTRFAGRDMLEICCGNGMATIALSEMGCDPFCMDSDQCAICEGLEHGVLAPRRSVVLDATELSAFFDAESFDCVIGFMLAIYPFNKDIWARIMSESAVLLRENGLLVFTVHKEEEIIILKEVMDAIGIAGEIIDNRDDAGVYDQWVYLGRKGSSVG